MTDHDFEPLDPSVQWIATEARRPVAGDPAARRRLLEALRAEPMPKRRPRVLALLLRRRSFVMPPLAAAAMAAGLVALGFISGYAIHRDGRLPAGQRSAVV